MLRNGGFLRLDPAFAYAEASFLMTFAMGGVPHEGSRHFFDCVISFFNTELLELFVYFGY